MAPLRPVAGRFVRVCALHCLGAMVLAGGLTGAAGPAGQSFLRLQAGTFDPLVDTGPGAASSIPAFLRRLPAPDDLVLLQLREPGTPARLAELRRLGAVLFDYVPDHSWLARVPPASRGDLRRRPFVRALIPYLPAYRVAPDLAAVAGGDATRPLDLLIRWAPDRAPSQVRSAVAGAIPSASQGGSGREPRATLLEITVDAGRLPDILARLAALPEVFWIEERHPLLPRNQTMKGVLQSGSLGSLPIFGQGLTGAGKTIAVSDTGLDTAHCFFTDPGESVTPELIDPDAPPVTPLTNPSHRKVLAYQYHAGSDTVDQDGHGTHVSGTASGDDLATPASGSDPGLDPYDGMAPGARLVFQDVDKSGGFLDVPVNLYGFVQAAYNAGARVHTNSWSADTSAYTSNANSVDGFTWDHPDMLFLFAAGNDGPNAGSIDAPSTAKNVISVGMVSPGDPELLEPSSSRGPTSDGRRKPDMVNIGGFPVRSAAADTACGLVNLGGTSMATPGLAGAAALVRQYLTGGFHPHGYAGSGPALAPSAALVKAVLANGAVGISGAGAPIPDNTQGWGRVLLDRALFFPSEDERLLILANDDVGSTADGLAVGATAAESFDVFTCRTDVPLKVTLVWSEPPVAPTSGQAWVNDLNLEVITPGSVTYLGNVFSGGVSSTGGTADDRNNIEQVLIPAGAVASGTHTIRVVPASVAVGPQPYALIVTGDVSAAAAPSLAVTSVLTAGGCDGDVFLDGNETLDLAFGVQNVGCGDAGPLDASLLPAPGFPAGLPLQIAPASVPLPGLASGESGDVTFQVHLDASGGTCGQQAPLLLRLQAMDGARWQGSHLQLLRLDPAGGERDDLDDVESGDGSLSHAAAWQINSCATSSGVNSWHLGATDCTGIPRDASSHSLEFQVPVAAGEDLASASFVHAFDGYSNASLADRIFFEIDHDADGSYAAVASWQDGAAPTSMTLAGPYDLSGFNAGRAAAVRFRFRFQGSANWVGPDNAPGWNVDDFNVHLNIFAACDVNSQLPPGDVGPTLVASPSDNDLVLTWQAVPEAASYEVRRSLLPDLGSFDAFSVVVPAYTDPGVLAGPEPVLYYKTFSVSGCGAVSDN